MDARTLLGCAVVPGESLDFGRVASVFFHVSISVWTFRWRLGKAGKERRLAAGTEHLAWPERATGIRVIGCGPEVQE